MQVFSKRPRADITHNRQIFWDFDIWCSKCFHSDIWDRFQSNPSNHFHIKSHVQQNAIWCHRNVSKSNFLSIAGSPSLPTNGTVLPNGVSESFFPSMPSPPNSVASTTAPAGPNPGPQSALIPPPNSVYLPPFPFAAHPELLHKSPFLPYGALRPTHPLAPAQHSEQNGGRLSPASSRNSSSPPSNNQSTPNHKINSSCELNSTNDHSSHSSSDDSDDEHIDVVKSAFVPILRPTMSATITTTNTPDSTVKEELPTRDIPLKIKSELKAPSSKKLQLHEKAPQDVPRSPDTKLKSPSITQQPKTVWRPY